MDYLPALLKTAIFLYLLSAGIVWARVLQVEWLKWRGQWPLTTWELEQSRCRSRQVDWGYVALCVFAPLIPVLNMALAYACLTALLDESQ
jgi:hypothetical protein